MTGPHFGNLQNPLHDPAASYRREFFDLAWQAASLGWQVIAVGLSVSAGRTAILHTYNRELPITERMQYPNWLSSQRTSTCCSTSRSNR